MRRRQLMMITRFFFSHLLPAASFKPTELRRAARIRALASSWLAGEEERHEPEWPVLLEKYYRKKVGLAQDDEMKASIRKVMAERTAGRAQDAADRAEAEAKQAREEIANLERQPAITPPQAEAKLQKLIHSEEGKEKVIEKEIEATDKLLEEDERRDLARKDQVDSEGKESEAMEGVKDAQHQLKLRMARRNTVPGVIAVNRFGLEITSKAACDAEENTEWVTGKCRVAGEMDGPDVPEEVKAFKSVEDLQSEREDALEDLSRAQHKEELTADELRNAEFSLKVWKNKHLKPSEEDNKELAELEKKAADQQSQHDSAQKEVKKAKESVKEKSKNLEKALQELLRVETQELKRDDESLASAGRIKDAAETDLQKVEDKLAEEELEEAASSANRSDALEHEAEKLEGQAKDDLLEEAADYRLWQKDLEKEAESFQNHDAKAAVKFHLEAQEDALAEQEAHRKAVLDGASQGLDVEALEKQAFANAHAVSNAGGGEDAAHEDLSKLLQKSADDGNEALEATQKTAQIQSHKNALTQRQQDTMRKLKEINQAEAKQASLGSFAPSIVVSLLREGFPKAPQVEAKNSRRYEQMSGFL
eukprot:TRINITY_DN1276_c0_g6_i1.p1 TRINITY_DN1276_c0_g6~~TRINITY_DN1276_c0_g6_i1.p1  ORF type:complete len:593 (-),score=188.11 TRINITY_DN1276_c0_g6_i1:61-1839(-)